MSITLNNHLSVVSSSLGHFFNLSLTFMTLILWKSTDQLFCGTSLNLSFPDVPSWLESRYIVKMQCPILLIASYGVVNSLLISLLNSFLNSLLTSANDVHIGYLITMTHARLLHYKLTLSFSNYKYFVKRHSETM